MPSIVKELTISVDSPSVFNALTTADGIACWWTDDVSIKPEVGSLAEFRFQQGKFILQFEIAELNQDKKVYWILRQGAPWWVGTTVTWKLEPVHSGTRVFFSHDGLAQTDESYESTRGTWEYFLNSLKSYLETGKGTPGFPLSA